MCRGWIENVQPEMAIILLFMFPHFPFNFTCYCEPVSTVSCFICYGGSVENFDYKLTCLSYK